MFQRSVLPAFAALAALMLGSEAVAACRSFEARPQTLGGMDRLLHQRLDDKDDGVAIKFGGKGQILSVIRFDDGQSEITDALLRNKLAEVADGIREAIESRGDKVISREPLPQWLVGKRTFLAETVTATYKDYDVTAFEYVGLSHDAECYFMVRFTNAADPDASSSLDRYKTYVEEAHLLLLKREEVVDEPEETEESPAGTNLEESNDSPQTEAPEQTAE